MAVHTGSVGRQEYRSEQFDACLSFLSTIAFLMLFFPSRSMQEGTCSPPDGEEQQWNSTLLQVLTSAQTHDLLVELFS